MTKELLEDYPHICAELCELERTVTDTVQGSVTVYPYTMRSVTIRGVPRNDQEQIAFLKAQKAEIEEFVRSLPNSELKLIVELKAYRRLKWDVVTAKLTKQTGLLYTVEGVKKKYYRLFK